MNLRKLLLIQGFIIILALSGPCAGRLYAQEEPKTVSSEVEKGKLSIIAEGAQTKTAPTQILSLEDCIDIAVRNHLPLKIAKKSVKLAEWKLWEAKRNMLPKTTFQWQEYTGKVYDRHYYGKKMSADIQWTVFHGGEFYYTMKQAETNLNIVNKEYARVKNELILQVRKGYYTLAKAKENYKLQTELSQEVSRIYDMVNKEFEAGVASNLEFLNVTSQSNQVKFQFTSARGDVEVANLILKQAMTMDVKENIDIDSPLEFKKVDIDFENVLADAMVRRPEMQINSLMISYYLYQMKVAKSKSWPKIDLLGSFGMAKEQFIAKDMGVDPATGVDSPEKLEQQWYGGVKCSVPVWGSTTEYSYMKEQWVPQVATFRGSETITNSVKFNFLDNLAQYSEKYSADVDVTRARQELIKTRQDVTLEVKEACFNYEKAVLQLDTAANKVKYQEGDLELAKFRRQMDEAPDSNVVESMIKLAQERFGYVQALSDCNIALAAISKAVGTADYFKYQSVDNKNNHNK